MPKKTSQTLGPTMPVRFHPEVATSIRETARLTRLSDADTIRKATEMGLPLLLQALGCSPAPKPVKPQRRKRLTPA